MMGLAVLASEASDNGSNPSHGVHTSVVGMYLRMTAQCLFLGEYTRNGPYILETLSHYTHLEFAVRADTGKDIWVLFGITVNAAMRMGLHRDPGNFSGISPVRAEMRRRLWAAILQGDVLFAGQMGMPRMISYAQCDTIEPANVHDEDLLEDQPEAPVSRPETEFTSTLSIIAQRRVCMVLGAIMDLSSRTRPCDYAEVMQLDHSLDQVASAIPPPLKMKEMTDSIADPPSLIMSRLFIQHLILKGKITLHHRFLQMQGSGEITGEYSRDSCLNATLAMLRIQQTLQEETRTRGQLHEVRWRVSSVMNHQFLTATLTLCSMLYRGQVELREEIGSALRGSKEIWALQSQYSVEARKAAESIVIVLADANDSIDPSNFHDLVNWSPWNINILDTQ